MNTPEIPIVCTLSDDEFRERERRIQQKFKGAVVETREIDGGFTFRFSYDDALLGDLNEFIVLEHRCCPFLDFMLTVKRGDADVWLALSGSEGAKEFIATTFAP